jgi:nucleoside-diphosphate-sugar epimerase
MTQRSYLVTGGAGFIGSALVRRLLTSGHRVVVFDDASRGKPARLSGLGERLTFIAGDIRDAAAVHAATRGVDVVCHLASINGTIYFYQKPELVLEVGVKGIMNVIDACKAHSVPELMVMSSSEVYQTPSVIPTPEDVPMMIPDVRNPRYSYAIAKMVSEAVAINAGRTHFRRVIIIRPHNVYGPDMGTEHVIPQFILRMKGLLSTTEDPLPFPIHGSPDETRAFVYIEDFIDGVMIALEKSEHMGIYHVGTSEEVSVSELAHAIATRYGRRIRLVPGPSAEGGTSRRCPDISRLRALGFAPAYSLAVGLARTMDWYERHDPGLTVTTPAVQVTI